MTTQCDGTGAILSHAESKVAIHFNTSSLPVCLSPFSHGHNHTRSNACINHSMLAGTFSALAIVAYDLIEPFRGSYQVSQCVDQLYTLRLTLDAQIEDDVRNRRTGVK
mmetsp:Transcript_22516/g.62824  ORF Transcript_22516/g.62824 Transcript_22516/m.62824 type:complete len:108 (-) Transcript_22516:68-391(-)